MSLARLDTHEPRIICGRVRRVRYGWGGSITSKVRQCVDGNMGHSLLFSAGLKLGWTGFELTFANTSFGSIYSTMPSSSLIVFWSRLSWLNRVVRSSKLGGRAKRTSIDWLKLFS
ncbi:hypothetical protein YC2023_030775 [Brassica napus]